MVVRKLDELLDLVLKGWKPYYHKSVGRWYLRRGNRRMLIDKSLDRVAEEIHKVLEYLKKYREIARRELIRKAIVLRASGLTVNEVIEATSIPRSTLYRYL
jgi:hypothetical protein